jgi:hypothetical protein
MWLVQRCKPKVTFYAGEKVSDYMSLDYMGSAEFEFGAIPKSIRKLAQKNLVQTSFKFRNSKKHDFTIHVLADHNEQGEAVEAIRAYLEGKNGARRLKEWIRLGDIVDESSFQSSDPETFWWCVDENSNYSTIGDKPAAEKNRIALEDPSLNFAFSLDPEQCRCFKLALQKSFASMQ